MPDILPTINNEPAQGIQALLDTVYLWNPDVANGLIDKVNELLEELGELSNISGAIKPYSQLEAPVRQYMPMSYNDGVYVANEEMATLPATPDLSKWTLIATKVDEQAIEAVVANEAEARAAADSALQGRIQDETLARQAADNNLQTQIDAISAASDVTDIVGTHAELENYDTSTLSDNDIIKVLQDETQEDATTYYRWVAAEDEFQLIGEEGPYYTKAQTDTLLDAKQDIMQFETMPEADASNANKVIQYVGEDIPESPASAVATQTTGSGLTDLSVNVNTFVEAEQPSGSETVSFVATVGNKQIVGDTTKYLGPNGDVELTVTNPSAFVEKVKNAWDEDFGEQYGYFEDVVDGLLITAMGDTNLGTNVVREIDCGVGGSYYAVAPVFPDASEWYLQVASTPMLDGEWGTGFDLGKNVTWSKNGTVVNLADYGVAYSGTPIGGDTISVAYTPEVSPVTSGYFYVNTPAYSEPVATIEQTVGGDSISFETTSGNTTISGNMQAFNNLLATIGWSSSDVPSTGTLEFKWERADDAWYLTLPESGWGDLFAQESLEEMGFVFTGTPVSGDKITATYQFGLFDLSVDVDTFVETEQPSGSETVSFVANGTAPTVELYNQTPGDWSVSVNPAVFIPQFENETGLTLADIAADDECYLEYYTKAGWVLFHPNGQTSVSSLEDWGFDISGDLVAGLQVFIRGIPGNQEWSKNGTTVDLADYGISYSGTPVTGDTLAVVYTASSISGYAWNQINVQPGGTGGIKWAGRWDKPASTTWTYYYPHYTFPTLPNGNYEIVVQNKSLYQYSNGIQVWSHKTFKITFGVTNHRARGIAAWVLDGNTDFYNYNMSSIATFTHWSTYDEPNPLDRIAADIIGACRIGNATIRASDVEGIFRWTNIKNTDTGEEIPVEIDVRQNQTSYGNQLGVYNTGNPVDPPHIPAALSYTTGDCNDSTQYIMFGDTLLPQVHTVAMCGSFKIVLKDVDGSEWRCVVENNVNSYVARVLKATGIFVNTQLGWSEGANVGGTCVFLNTPAGTDKTIEMWVSLYGTTVSANCWLTQSVSNFTPVLVTRPGSLVTKDNFGLIEQYTGETDANYTNGYFYKATGTKVNVPESIATTTVSPVGEVTVTIDLTNWIDAVAATYGWSGTDIRSWLTDYANNTWNLSYNVDNGEVTRMYLPWYGDTYEQNILQYITVDYTGSQEGEVWIEFQEQYTKAHTEIQNGRWERIDVQPAGETYTAGTGIDITGGVISVITPVTSTGVGGLVAGSGYSTTDSQQWITRFGRGTQATGAGSSAFGNSARATGSHSTALGNSAYAYADYAIQLGMGTNSDANTFKVGLSNNSNYELLSADGTIPEARLADTTNAQQGDVLTLDSTGNAVWQAGGGGATYTAGTGISIDANNEISVTAPTLTNANSTNDSIVITDQNPNTYNVGSDVVIGKSITFGSVGSTASVAIGKETSVGQSTVAIGYQAKVYGTSKTGIISIGYKSNALGNHCIQLNASGNSATNSDDNTFKVANANGNYEIMSADGTVPTARLTKVNTTITLTAAGWSNSSQTVNVTGMTADGIVFVNPTPANQSAYTSAGILCTAQAAGSLTFTCDTTPSADITVTVVML